MKTNDLHKIGIPVRCMKTAFRCIGKMGRAGLGREDMETLLSSTVKDPEQFIEHELVSDLAKEITSAEDDPKVWQERETPARYQAWAEDLEKSCLRQMDNACRIPVAVRGALMPDAHTGYGIPIGGVLATENAVIPYAVGVDISCSMNFTITDIPMQSLRGEKDRLAKAIEEETAFGMGSTLKAAREHDVMDSEAWNAFPEVRKLRDKAANQLGSSGGGNHFVEFGIVEIPEGSQIDLPAGEYVALMSHSGSRGAGATIANHYSRLAMQLRSNVPKELHHLAWLNLDSDAGREYWHAMTLMGEYAEACHRVIHHHVLKAAGGKSLHNVFNRHNFAWKETHDGREVVVHRKGATPAFGGQPGIIPGSMADPAFIVTGKGSPNSLCSASHGAGRAMSRRKASETVNRAEVRAMLRERGVTLLSAGIDESPNAYKNIRDVMALQTDLVDIQATFMPAIVKMAPPEKKKDRIFGR